ncbi:MAG: LysM peptidoglycan-binding domain-containing protein [Flavobacteriales bacterium]|nr:LysM peptidoglycan-binding domain-containing protein [Flavobacteriales bacterium]MCB9449462.1 LysM peptidoglycan-binding domain-containing protein [Flavobacteriales bacterium]
MLSRIHIFRTRSIFLLLAVSLRVVAAEDSLQYFNTFTVPDLNGLMATWDIQRTLLTDGYQEPKSFAKAMRNMDELLEEAGIQSEWHSLTQLTVSAYMQTYRKETEYMLGYMAHYLPMIRQELEQAGLPSYWEMLPAALSAMNACKDTEEGRTGLWQLSYPVALRYGLQVNDYVDQRLDPYLSTRAAVKYLKHLTTLYNQEEWVLAAFMTSPAHIGHVHNRSGSVTDLYHAFPSLSPRGQAAWGSYMALRTLQAWSEKQKAKHPVIDYPTVLDTVSVQEDMFFHQVSTVLNLPEGRLQQLNRPYKKSWVPAGSILILPSPYKKRFEALRDSVAHFHDSLMVHPDSMYAIQTDVDPADTGSPSVPSGDVVELYYRVKSGDNLGYIASWYDVKVSELRNWNSMSDDRIQVGEDLLVYVRKDQELKYKDVDDLSFAQKQARVGKAEPTVVKETKSAPPVQETNKAAPPKGKYIVYEVKRGDSLWGIAKKYPGVTEENLMKWNGIDSHIRPGQKIRIYQP